MMVAASAVAVLFDRRRSRRHRTTRHRAPPPIGTTSKRGCYAQWQIGHCGMVGEKPTAAEGGASLT